MQFYVQLSNLKKKKLIDVLPDHDDLLYDKWGKIAQVVSLSKCTKVGRTVWTISLIPTSFNSAGPSLLFSVGGKRGKGGEGLTY